MLSVPSLEWIGPQIVQHGHAQLGESALPDAQRRLGIELGVLLHEGDFPIADTDRHQVAVVAPVEEALRGDSSASPLKKGMRLSAVEMDLEGLAVELVALHQLRDQIGLARRRGKGRDEVLVRADVVDDRAGLDHAGPADQARNAERAFPVGRLLALERRGAAVRPRKTSAPLSVV